MLQTGTLYLLFVGQRTAPYKKTVASSQAVEEPAV
jgi:hypothetical protein